jgi:hypothetical protein
MGTRADTARTERATWLRLAVAVLIGVCALLVPALAPHVGRTGAVFTDQEQTSTDVRFGPTESPSDIPSDPSDPPSDPSDVPSDAP